MAPLGGHKKRVVKRKFSSKEIRSPVAKKARKECQEDDEQGGAIEEDISALPWRKVLRPSATGFEGDDGILELEEVEDVEVVYEELDSGRVARFLVKQPSIPGDSAKEDDKSAGTFDTHTTDEQTEQLASEDEDEETFDTEELLPKWLEFPLHPLLMSSLHRQGFHSPTPIQASALPPALRGKDVVGVAETGSGKTLAYGLPILNDLLRHKRAGMTRASLKGAKRPLAALVLAPTRELALQVVEHLKAGIMQTAEEIEGKGEDDSSGNSKAKGKARVQHSEPRVSVAAVVGGMSAQKQRRILDRGVDVLVATPGRLWDLIEEDDGLAEQIKGVRFLVLDEADRMVEAGHFAELDNILRLTTRQFRTSQYDPEFPSEEAEEAQERENCSAVPLQTFVFSATLSHELQQNLKKRKRVKALDGQSKNAKDKRLSTLDELLLKLDFRDPEPEVIDLSPEGGAVSTLRESQVQCLSADKDAYLYYFLLRYPGRTLVFLSAVDGIRRLLPLLSLLGLPAYPLHSHLQQRQRLKNLDRFRSSSTSCVLLATDVAARGLDILNVDHVIHYQLPRSADAYVHRNGRTARAARDGFSLLICAPDERKMLKALLASFGRTGENEIPEMPIELNLLDQLKARIQLAKKIDVAQHRVRKEKHEKIWMREAADAMEIELDSDREDALSDGEERGKKQKKVVKETQEVQRMKMQLVQLLAKPLIARGVMKKYVTSGVRNVVSELLENDGRNVEMLGFSRGAAKDDLAGGLQKHWKERRAKRSKGDTAS